MKKPFLYIAKSKQNFDFFLNEYRHLFNENEIPKTDFRYITSVDSVRGLDNCTLIKGSHYFLNKDYIKILDEAEIRKNIQIVTEKEFINYIANLNVTAGNQPPKK